MTLKEAVLESLRPYPIRETLVDKMCIDFGLDPETEYLESLKESAMRIEVMALKQYASLSSVAQSGSRTVYRNIRYRIAQLLRELGENPTGYSATVKIIDL